MAKLQTKSDNINPFGGLFSIFKTFDKSGVRNVIDRTLGPRGTLLAFSHGDIFASLLGCYLTGGDCIEDVMDIKPFWNSLFGTEYVYRCILTNDWDNSEKAIIEYYNKRGDSERNFDCQNNDFGWAHLPFSFLKENTVFLIATVILKNFYLYFLDMLRGRAEGIDCSTRVKRFVRKFVNVPAKWTRSGRMDVLTLYTKRQIYLSLCT